MTRTAVLVVLVGLCTLCTGEPVYAEPPRTILLREGRPAPGTGVLLLGSPAGLQDLQQVGGAGWWVPDPYVVDATGCFNGCPKLVQAAEERGNELERVARQQGQEQLAACESSCAERIKDLAKPDPFPWGTVAIAGSVGLVVGAVLTGFLVHYTSL